MFESGVNGGRFAASIVVLALALGGCEGFKNVYDPPPVDPNIRPVNYRTEVASLLRTYLEHPVGVRDAGISEPALRPVGKDTRYVSCVRYNAKDAGGQYQGITERVAVYFGGRINQFVESNREWCAAAVYQRFPEAEKLVP